MRIAFVIAIFLSLSLFPALANHAIQTGADQPEGYLPLLNDKRVGLVVNQTSRTHGMHLVDFLLDQGINIKSIFAPEHGFRGNHGAGESVQDGIDAQTGIPVLSIYGKTKKPTPAMLDNIELLVFDIQDVGTRFYTYISTMHYVMEAAAENQIPVVILDRPNPNGRFVDGPILDPTFQSFVGMHPIPLLHGMTVGELALMIKGENWINQAQQLPLTVIPVVGYHKSLAYSLPVAPSPNLPNDIAIRLYPSLCLFEATTVSIGRGTPYPFQVLGHDKVELGKFSFTPKSLPASAPHPKLEGVTLTGADLRESTISGFELSLLVNANNAFAAQQVEFIDRPDFFDLLAGTDLLRKQLAMGMDARQIRETWEAPLAQFKQTRTPYLLYPD